MTDKKTGRATPIPYADVEKVQGSGLSKGAKIGIIAGAAVAIVAVVIAVGVCRAGTAEAGYRAVGGVAPNSGEKRLKFATPVRQHIPHPLNSSLQRLRSVLTWRLVNSGQIGKEQAIYVTEVTYPCSTD